MNFSERFFDNFFLMMKAMLFYFGAMSYPLWMLWMVVKQDWLSLAMMVFTPIMIAGFAFFVSFRQNKDKEEF